MACGGSQKPVVAAQLEAEAAEVTSEVGIAAEVMEVTVPKRRTLVATAVCSTLVGFSTTFVVSATLLICGIFFAELLKTFGQSRGETAIVGSVLEFTYSAGCLPVPALVRRLGAVRTYGIGAALFVGGLVGDSLAGSLQLWVVTHGLCAGLGMAILFMTHLDVMYKRTPKSHRGLCIGISFAGGGIGAAVLAPLLTLSAEQQGLSKTMALFAMGVAIHLSMVLTLLQLVTLKGHLFVDPPAVSHQQQHTSTAHAAMSKRQWMERCSKNSVVSWFTNTQFLTLFVALFIYLFGYSVPLTHVPRFAEDRGLDPAEAATLMSIFGILNAVGRIFFSYLGDRTGGEYLKVFSVTVLGNGLAVLALPLCLSYASFVCFAVVCGLVAGGRAGVLSLVCCQLFGQEQASRAYALLCLAFMFSQTFGSPVVGYLYDDSGSYSGGFVLTGSLMLLAFFFLVLLDWRRRASRRAALPSASSSQDLVTA